MADYVPKRRNVSRPDFHGYVQYVQYEQAQVQAQAELQVERHMQADGGEQAMKDSEICLQWGRTFVVLLIPRPIPQPQHPPFLPSLKALGCISLVVDVFVCIAVGVHHGLHLRQ